MQKNNLKNKAIRTPFLIWIGSIIIFFLLASIFDKQGKTSSNFGTVLMTTDIVVGVFAFIWLTVVAFFNRMNKKKDIIPKKEGKKISLKVILLVLTFLGLAIFYNPFFKQTEPNVINGKYVCPRTEPYKLQPEFERARSLRMQRLNEAGVQLNQDFYNCINIKYASTDEMGTGVEGMFRFDKNSRLDELTIFVSPSYQAKDDILTAILLSHELIHVGQFLGELNGDEPLSCVEKEAEAFVGEIGFVYSLNTEERNSLFYRAEAEPNNINYSLLWHFNSFLKEANNRCGQNFPCQQQVLKEKFINYVTSNPAYQEQCNLK